MLNINTCNTARTFAYFINTAHLDIYTARFSRAEKQFLT